MPASTYTPYSPNSFLWDTTATTYRGAPVVYKNVGFTVTNPAASSADRIAGVAWQDAGPSAPAQATSVDVITVLQEGVVQMYAKGTINPGDVVKIGPTISITPPGYSSAITVYTAQTVAQTAGGSPPYPVLGIAVGPATSADGDYCYIYLCPGMFF